MRAGGGDIELAGLCKSYDGVTNVVDRPFFLPRRAT